MSDVESPEKDHLHLYLRRRREELLGTLDGLDEYDVRRPLVPSGTNLLGLVKHVASVELGYFGEVFGRPAELEAPWLTEGAEPDADLWATADESREAIVDFARRAGEHVDATIRALPLDAPGSVPWWPADRREVTLHQVLVHMLSEAARHAGHADIVRELVDGRLGTGPGDPNVVPHDEAGWRAHRDRVEAAAREAADREAGDREAGDREAGDREAGGSTA